MRALLLALLWCGILGAQSQQIEITSDRFEADERKGESLFVGHVEVRKGKEWITSERLRVGFDAKKKPVFFEASGDVKFLLLLQESKRYEGSAASVAYDALTKEYRLNGKVRIEALDEQRTLLGERAVLNQKNGKAEVVGGKNAPVKFIFSVPE